MKRRFRFTAVCEDLSWVEQAAANHLARKRSKTGRLLYEDQIPEAFRKYDVGNRYGHFQEIIEYREIRTDGIPTWFQPKTEPGHIGLIAQSGLRVYMRLSVDDQKRSEPSIFDQMIMEFAERTPEQTSLF